MNEINMVELVLNNLEFLGFAKDFCFKNIETLKFFLEKDITAILGKTTFKVDSFNESKSELHIIKFKNNNQAILRIITKDTVFDFVENDEDLVLLNNQTGLKLFKISAYKNLLKNILVTIDEPNITSEIQRHNLNDDSFEYTKTIKCCGETYKYPMFKMEKIGSKIQDKELFELSYLEDTSNMNFIERINYFINHKQNKYITTGYKADDKIPYIQEIFELMEEECNKYDNIKIRRK